MPKTLSLPPSRPIPKPTVRTLVPSVTALAKHIGVTNNAIYRWFKVNRIPGEHIIKVANFYDIEIAHLLPLTGSDLSSNPNVVLKARNTLPTLIRVQRGEITLQEARDTLDQSLTGIKLILTHWGEDLPKLYDTLCSLDAGLITLDDACTRLGLTKYTVHGIRRKYGFAPGPVKRTNPLPTLPARKQSARRAALSVIAGEASAVDAARSIGVSSRTLFRHIEALTSHKVGELSSWPTVFRQALAYELDKNMMNYAEKWLEKAKELNLFIRKAAKYPETPASWKEQPLRRMLIAVLLSELTLNEMASARGADARILESLFTSDLRSIGLTFPEVRDMSLSHHMALAELLMWMTDRKRAV
jgi:transposase-like protein